MREFFDCKNTKKNAKFVPENKKDSTPFRPESGSPLQVEVL